MKKPPSNWSTVAEKSMREQAAFIVEFWRGMPFYQKPVEISDKLKNIIAAADSLHREIFNLVPKGKGSLEEFPFNSHLAMQFSHAYSALYALRNHHQKSHWIDYEKVQISGDYRKAPAGLLLLELERFIDASKQVIEWEIPKNGRPSKGDLDIHIKTVIARNFVCFCQGLMPTYPPVTQDGWAVVFLEGLFNQHSLGTGAEYYLRSAIQSSVASGLTRELLEKEWTSRVAKGE